LLAAALTESRRLTGDSRCIARTRNPQAVAFYMANGFTVVGSERRGAAILTVLLKSQTAE
jgi:ribosomal protein S18 acetylase RimI-like enzyme